MVKAYLSATDVLAALDLLDVAGERAPNPDRRQSDGPSQDDARCWPNPKTDAVKTCFGQGVVNQECLNGLNRWQRRQPEINERQGDDNEALDHKHPACQQTYGEDLIAEDRADGQPDACVSRGCQGHPEDNAGGRRSPGDLANADECPGQHAHQHGAEQHPGEEKAEQKIRPNPSHHLRPSCRCDQVVQVLGAMPNFAGGANGTNEGALEQGTFDLNKLSRSIDQARADGDLTWTQLSQEVGVATSTIRRFASASDAEADGVLVLIGWLGVAPEQFVVDSDVVGELLPPAGDGVIRVDMSLVTELPASPRRARVGTRTTIQRLVMAAQQSNVTIASVTRWSPI